MRSALLSEKEREIVEKFIMDGVRLEGFAMLKFRIKKHISQITFDYELILSFIAKSRDQTKWDPKRSVMKPMDGKEVESS